MEDFHPLDDYTSVHERRPALRDAHETELCKHFEDHLMTRVKLEQRTFWMRIAIGLFTGSWAGFLIALATEKIVITP